jgi:hypothetical protein
MAPGLRLAQAVRKPAVVRDLPRHSLRITYDEGPVYLAPALQRRLTEEEHDGHDWAHGLATTRRDA